MQKTRINIFKYMYLLVLVVFAARSFDLQVIKGQELRQAADKNHQKKFVIASERGRISAMLGDRTVPLVLNEFRYNIVLDPSIINNPKYIKNLDDTIRKIDEASGVSAADIRKLVEDKSSRYARLLKNVDRTTKDKLYALKIPGLSSEQFVKRVYPQGSLAGQLLGFINDDGDAKYGVEQYFESELRGKDGKYKAITDGQGIPLLTENQSILEPSVAGQDVNLTIDLDMQMMTERYLSEGIDKAGSPRGSVLILEVGTNKVKAAASWPTFDVEKFYEVKDPSSFNVLAFSDTYEPGSVVKPLTVACGIDTGAVNSNYVFYDPGGYTINGSTIKNVVENQGASTRSIRDVLDKSLNTGTTNILMQIGGGGINGKARQIWHSYMQDKYYLNKTPSIEVVGAAAGILPDPENGFGLDLQYANTTFGQGMQTSLLSLGSALNAVVGGGKYNSPTIIESVGGKGFTAKDAIKDQQIVKPETSQFIVSNMEEVIDLNVPAANIPGYVVGGKSGTAQVANPSGGYYEDRFNGSYEGFVGKGAPKYLILVRMDTPKTAGYAGTQAASPVFINIIKELVAKGRV